MKITVERIAILVLGIIIIVFLLRDCARPSEQREADRKKMYETEIAILKVEKATVQLRQDSLVRTYKAKVRSDSASVGALESKISQLEKKAAIQRTPLVDVLVQDNPELLAYVTTQQEVITELKVEIDTLKSQAQFQRKLNEDLIIAEFMENKIEQQMALESTRRIEDLEKQSRKKERKSRLKTMLIPAVAALTFLLGSQL